jgi:aspartate racemase
MAGAYFMERLIALTPATSEQEHVPAILWSDPRVPSRPGARLEGGADPLPWMRHGVARLEQAGAQAIAIPCNTAHLWYEDLVAEARVPVLHIVDAAIADLHRQGIRSGRIGLMATAATLQLCLYQDRLEARGYECIVPSDDEVLRHCTIPIRHVKANDIPAACEPVAAGVERLLERGAQAVVLGCTELPLALPNARRTGINIPLVDSIDALALAALDWYYAGR